MTQKLKTFEPAVVRYPWDEWTDGSAYRVKHGRDFTCSIDGFITQLHRQASLRSKRVETVRREDGVVDFRYSPRAAARRAAARA